MAQNAQIHIDSRIFSENRLILLRVLCKIVLCFQKNVRFSGGLPKLITHIT
jgi:hypothetical protein